MPSKMKMSRVEILVVVVMVLQGFNYLFTMLGNPVKWGVDFSKRVVTLEQKMDEKCRNDSTYFAANLSDHTSMKKDISLIKDAVLTTSTRNPERMKF